MQSSSRVMCWDFTIAGSKGDDSPPEETERPDMAGTWGPTF
jgi:hypothetical protein